MPARSAICATSTTSCQCAGQRSGTRVSVSPPSALAENTPSLNRLGPCIGWTMPCASLPRAGYCRYERVPRQARRRDEDRLHRRRPGRSLFRDPDEAARPRASRHRDRAQSPGRHLRLGRGVLRRDAAQPQRRRSANRAAHHRQLRPLGRHRHPLQRPHRSAPAATASAASSASACSTSCRNARPNWASN